MQTNTTQKILGYIKSRGQASRSELVEFLSLSDRAIRKQLSALTPSKEKAAFKF